LVNAPERDLTSITNFGATSLKDVNDRLEERGLSLRVETNHARHPNEGQAIRCDSAHQKAMMGNLVASMIAAESIVTTEAKAKALRPIVEKVVTAAKNSPEGSVHANRRVVAFIRDKDMTHKLFTEIAPRYTDRPGATRES